MEVLSLKGKVSFLGFGFIVVQFFTVFIDVI